MTLSEIRQINRRMLDDQAKTDTQRYWPNSELDEYINTVVEEFAERTLCILDSLTDPVCLITLVANQRHYSISDSILRIETVQPSWQEDPLSKQSIAVTSSSWLTNVGLPFSYLLDYSSGKLSLTAAPTAVTTETLRLSIKRLPLAELISDSDIPEIPRQYHRKLMDGVLALAYSKQDSEKYNPAKAKYHRDKWEEIMETAVRREARLKPRIIVARRTEMI